jgi:hypothetical protein
MTRKGWVAFSSCLAIALALGDGCSGGRASVGAGGSDGGTSTDGTTGGSGCTTNTDCTSQVPVTTPPGCATGKCDSVQGVCTFVAKDQDGDGDPAANCKANNGTPIQTGGDCNDDDPGIYSGHTEDCSALDDGGTVTWPTGSPTGVCAYGTRSCEPDGGESACTGTKGPQARDCNSGADNDCDGKPDSSECACDPPASQCTGNAAQQCQQDGTWGTPVDCTNQTCIAGICTGACAAGQTTCTSDSTGVQTCTSSGTWGTPAACVNQTCSASDAAGGDGGTGAAPDGSADSGADAHAACGGVCAPGQTRCSGNVPQSCGGDGQWVSASACADVCTGGQCTGNCVPGSTQCLNGGTQQNAVVTCPSTGVWPTSGGTLCSNKTCLVNAEGVASCQGSCAPTQTAACNPPPACNPSTVTCGSNGVMPACPTASNPTWGGGTPIGGTCTAGTGACQNSGTVYCGSTTTAACNAVGGTAQTYHDTAAPNGSWDWNCDGSVELQYGDVLPAAICPTSLFCTGANPDTEGNCASSLNFISPCGTLGPPPNCGQTFIQQTCNWTGSTCADGFTNTLTMGCE